MKPSSKCSLGRADGVKDYFKWLDHASEAYIVLSTAGFLSHGNVGGQALKDVFENTDAGPCLFLILFLLQLNLSAHSMGYSYEFCWNILIICEICHMLKYYSHHYNYFIFT